MTVPIFDGHNDFLLRLLRNPDRRAALWPAGDGSGHIDLRRLQAAGVSGGMFAMFVPSAGPVRSARQELALDARAFGLPQGPALGQGTALRASLAMASHLKWMSVASAGALQICRTAAELRDCQQKGCIGAVLHLEGAEAIDADLTALDQLEAFGLGSLGLVWSRPNIFGHGVPFRFPADPDIGPGLTEAGRRLVAECNRRRILIDLSHLNASGFNDVARLSDAPLVATHSNAHAITPSSRNLTDAQLDQIAASGGIVGVNFGTVLLRHDGRRSPVMGWSALLRHLDHLISRMGEDHVGFGSDFDGTMTPQILPDVTAFTAIRQVLERRGYGAELLRKLCHGNWHAVLERTWGS